MAAATSVEESLTARLLPWAVGVWLAVTLLKFGNPVILDKMVLMPTGLAEFLFASWPLKLAIPFILVAVAMAVPIQGSRLKAGPWFLWLPVAWLFWQKIAATNSVAPELSSITLWHFVGIVLAFFIGYAALAKCRDLRGVWIPLLVAFTYVLWTGFEQQHGGLEAMRRMIYEQPNWQELPPDYLKKIASNRIFSTLVYPNALAGAIILLFPPLAWKLRDLSAKWPRILRAVIIGLFAYASVACFYWTGSKAGWLIAISLVGLWVLNQPQLARYRYWIAGLIIIVGLSAFFLRFQGYFQRGATSVSARFIYWDAAWKTAVKHPLTGTGPGTFQKPFAEIKPPDAEMTRLAHNDYLEQASDSGFIGFALYCAMISAFVWKLYRKSDSRFHFLIFLGILGFALQGVVEFGLYIPALAWTAFLLMGYGLGVTGKKVENSPVSSVSEQPGKL